MDESERELLKRALNVLHNARVEIEVVREHLIDLGHDCMSGRCFVASTSIEAVINTISKLLGDC